MSKKTIDGDEVPIVLYTVASNEATNKAKADLEVKDPEPDRALEILKGQSQDEPKTN